MSNPNGKIVFIPGGAGNVGEGLVRSFLRQGATAIVSSWREIAARSRMPMRLR